MTTLPDELASALAALPPMENFTAAQTAANKLRVDFLNRAYSTPDFGLHASIARAINDLIDRYIANHAPIQDLESGWDRSRGRITNHEHHIASQVCF